MLGTAHGRVIKTGSSQYGPWFIVEEANTKADGTPYTKRYMCSSKQDAPEGATVAVTGTVIAKTREHDGKTYADVSLSFASFTVLGEEAAPSAPKSEPEFGDDIPF